MGFIFGDGKSFDDIFDKIFGLMVFVVVDWIWVIYCEFYVKFDIFIVI